MLVVFQSLKNLFSSSLGVQFDVRKLQLGDFLWVARERTVPTPGTVFTLEIIYNDHCNHKKCRDKILVKINVE